MIKLSKDKKIIESNNNDYFKEVLSFISIILLLIILAGIGILGYYGMLIFKIIFGEWTILLLIFFLISQIYYLIKKKAFEFHSITFQGFLFIYLGLTLMSHLTIYNGLGLTPKNVFLESLKLYKAYFASYDKNYYVGGGIIGLFLFQITIFILGNAGVILFSLAFIILGCANLCNHSVSDFFKKIIFCGNKLRSFKSKLSSFLRKITKFDDNRKSVKRKNPTINLLDDIKPSSNHNLELEISKELSFKVKEYILKNDPISSYIESYIGNTISSIVIQNASKDTIKGIAKIIGNPQIYKYGENIYFDYPNRFKELYTLKKALIGTDLKEIPLGQLPNGDITILDTDNYNSYLLCASKGYGLRNFVRCLIASIILIYKRDCIIKIWDLKNEYKEYFQGPCFIEYANEISKIQSEISGIANDYERRCEILNYLGTSNYLEANERIFELEKKIDIIKPIFSFVNIPLKSLNSDALSKLNFFISQGHKTGIFIFIMTRDVRDLEMIHINQMVRVIFKLSDLSMSLKLTKNDIALNLVNKGEALLIENEKIRHLETPFLSISDFFKIINRITF